MSNHPDRLSRLRLICLLEAITLLILLLVAVPLKHLAGLPVAVSVMGPVHGMAFLMLCWAVVHAVASRDISSRRGWELAIAALVPLGGLYSWRHLRSS